MAGSPFRKALNTGFGRSTPLVTSQARPKSTGALAPWMQSRTTTPQGAGGRTTSRAFTRAPAQDQPERDFGAIASQATQQLRQVSGQSPSYSNHQRQIGNANQQREEMQAWNRMGRSGPEPSPAPADNRKTYDPEIAGRHYMAKDQPTKILPSTVRAQLGFRTSVSKQLEQEAYDALTPAQRVVVDFNTALAEARSSDLSGRYTDETKWEEGYAARAKNVFGEGTTQYAPKTVALLESLQADMRGRSIDDVLNRGYDIGLDELNRSQKATESRQIRIGDNTKNIVDIPKPGSAGKLDVSRSTYVSDISKATAERLLAAIQNGQTLLGGKASPLNLSEKEADDFDWLYSTITAPEQAPDGSLQVSDLGYADIVETIKGSDYELESFLTYADRRLRTEMADQGQWLTDDAWSDFSKNLPEIRRKLFGSADR